MMLLESPPMPRRLPPGGIEDRDRHGNIRIYFRSKNRPKVRLRGTPWTREFMADYEAAKGAVVLTAGKGITPGTLLRRMHRLQAPRREDAAHSPVDIGSHLR